MHACVRMVVARLQKFAAQYKKTGPEALQCQDGPQIGIYECKSEEDGLAVLVISSIDLSVADLRSTISSRCMCTQRLSQILMWWWRVENSAHLGALWQGR